MPGRVADAAHLPPEVGGFPALYPPPMTDPDDLSDRIRRALDDAELDPPTVEEQAAAQADLDRERQKPWTN